MESSVLDPVLDPELVQLAEELDEAERALAVLRAIEDPYYWLTECTATRDEQDEENPNKPFPKYAYVEAMIGMMRAERIMFVEKSRTVMGTWCGCGVFAHEGFTTPQRRYVFQSKDEARAKNCIDYVKHLWRNSLPELQAKWPCKKPIDTQGQLILEMANGTIFEAIVGGQDKIRSKHPTGYMLDEGAHVEDGDDCLDVALAAKPLRVIVVTSAAPSWFRNATELALPAEPPIALPEGMAFRRNDKGIGVLRVHYSADPTKRSAAWKEQERKNYTNLDNWDLEMEIKYEAKSGERVYQEFEIAKHVVPHKSIPQVGSIYMCIDPHPRTPHAALWILIDPAGDWWVYRECWPSKACGELTLPKDDKPYTTWEFAEMFAILEGNRIEWKGSDADKFGNFIETGEVPVSRFMDPAGKAFQVSAEGMPYETQWMRYTAAGYELNVPYKIHNAGEDKVRELLKPRYYEGRGMIPRLHISDQCPELILEFTKYRYKPSSAAQLMLRDESQDPISARCHLLDCLRYIATSDAEYIPYLTSQRHESLFSTMRAA